jgi:hypothetical protein
MAITATITNTPITAEIVAGEITASVTSTTITADIGTGITTYIYGDFTDGTTTGDILRWNSVSGSWESKSEPLTFNGLVLNPTAAPLDDIEGGLWYKSTEKSVYVCTDDI